MASESAFYRVVGASMLGVLTLIIGCSSPFEQKATSELRDSIIASSERELRDAERHPEAREIERAPSELELSPERLPELEAMAGVNSYPQKVGDLGPDLLGDKGEGGPRFAISLEQAIRSAVSNNLELQIARLDPAIRQSQVVSAQAFFDWVFFADFGWNASNEAQTVPVINGVPLGAPASQSQQVSYSTGIRKDLTSGGRFTAEQGQTYFDDTGGAVDLLPDPSNSTYVSLRYDQPLLRGFGSDVALAEVRIAQNIERDSIEALRQGLLDTINQTERAYWELVQARLSLQIQRRLLERGIATRDVLKSRLGVDARPAEYSDAVARVEQRRADLIRAENRVRQASDELKRLINDPELSVGSEVVLSPVDMPIEETIRYSLAESLATALSRRPELQRSILAIDNASIRQTVARNARLPLLNFAIESRLQGLDSDVGGAYDDVLDSNFVNWIVSLAFEQPLGNREAEAGYRQRQLERLRATLAYRQTVQQLVLEVKTSLRNVQTNYRLIVQTRSSRLAAAENLRTLQVLEDTIASLNPEFLDLKFRRQEALAGAELDELSSLIDYNTSLADLSRATGQGLERNGIKFVVPEAGDYLDGK